MELDFGQISQQVSEYLKNPDSGTAETPTPASDSPVEAATPAPDGAPAPAGQAPPPEPMVEVDFGNGKVEKLTAKQIKEGWLRQQDYTKKTQELAEHRKQLEPIATAYQKAMEEREQIKELLSDPRALMYLLQQQVAAQGPVMDPNEPITAGQAQQYLSAQAQQLQQRIEQLEQKLVKGVNETRQVAAQEAQDLIETARHAESINATISSIYEEHPVLQSVPEMEDLMRWRVAQRKPQTIEEANTAFKEVGAELAKAINDKFVALNKQQVVTQQKLVTHGIEPPGGAGPQPSPESFRDPKTGAVDWKKLSAAATSYMDSRKR